MTTTFSAVSNQTLINPHTKDFFRSEADTALFYSLMEISGSAHYNRIDDIIIGKEVKLLNEDNQKYVNAVREVIAKVGSTTQ